MITPDLAAPSHSAAPSRAAPKAAAPGSARPFAEFVAGETAGEGAKDPPAPEPRVSTAEEVAPEAGAGSILPDLGGEFGQPVAALVRPEHVFAAPYAPAAGPVAKGGSMAVKGGVVPDVGVDRVERGVVPAEGEVGHAERRASSVVAGGAPADAGTVAPLRIFEPSATSAFTEAGTKVPPETAPVDPVVAPQPAEGARQAAPADSYLGLAQAQLGSLPPAREQDEAHVEAAPAVAKAALVSLAPMARAATPAYARAAADEGSAGPAQPHLHAAGPTDGSAAPAGPAAPAAPPAPSAATAVPAAAPAFAPLGQATEPAGEARPLDQPPSEAEAAPPPASPPVAAPAAAEARPLAASPSFGLERLQSAGEPGWRLSASQGSAALEKALTGPATPRELAGQITLAVTQATQPQVEIRLDPPELGRVQIQLNPTERGGLQAVVLADRPETQDFLRRNAETLVRDLTEAGYADVSLEFAAGGERLPQDPQPQERRFAPPFEPAPFLAPAPQAPCRAASRGLDVRL